MPKYKWTWWQPLTTPYTKRIRAQGTFTWTLYPQWKFSRVAYWFNPLLVDYRSNSHIVLESVFLGHPALVRKNAMDIQILFPALIVTMSSSLSGKIQIDGILNQIAALFPPPQHTELIRHKLLKHYWRILFSWSNNQGSIF